MEKIAIIGMGISGMAVLRAYEKHVDMSRVEIDCYDSEYSFGRGYPFREDSEKLILNLRTNKISYDYRELEDLGVWYREKDLERPDYPSRPVFGRYMKEKLQDTIEATAANVIYQRVKRIDKLDGAWEIQDEGGRVKKYDRVHLCNGVLGQKKLYDLEKADNYIDSVYPVREKLDSIKEHDRVLIIGTGLTAIDTASYLLQEKRMKSISMFSRNNIMPTVRVREPKVNIKYFTMTKLKNTLRENYGRISFEKFDQMFLRELKEQGIDFEDFNRDHMQGEMEGLLYNIENPDDLGVVQALLPYMNLILNKVWDSMTISDRKKFKEKYHTFICLNRSALQRKSADIIIRAYREGRLKLENSVRDVSINDRGKFILLDKNQMPINPKDQFDYALNGTGFDYSLENIEEVNPLLAQLLDKRYIAVDASGGISVLPGTMQVISPRFGTLENLHAHGVLTAGVQYRNNSTMIIQLTARVAIRELYK